MKKMIHFVDELVGKTKKEARRWVVDQDFDDLEMLYDGQIAVNMAITCPNVLCVGYRDGNIVEAAAYLDEEGRDRITPSTLRRSNLYSD